ncbi:MAG: 3-ketoacyl-ACP reductase [Bryobacterales bacterium]|jgi:NAD(P)-dependent dehydrogenase (short-subunit alcohol dehydrogenase family)|nr:3-ketoacyl-ACP reductase [Bryobacterales bacterium]
MSAQSTTRPVALVTGAARGIGRACALALAEAGFHLVLADREGDDHRDLLASAAEEARQAGADVVQVHGDIADLGLHAKLVQAAVTHWDRLDCLVNNAGVGVLRRGDLLAVTPESFDRCQQVNTRAVFFLSQAVALHFLRQGERDGHHRSIVNITSSNAEAVSINRGEYCVSKCASSMTTRLFALRLAEAGVGVYEVRPGVIATDMTLPAKKDYDQRIADGLAPMRRWGYPSDVANAVTVLAQGRLPYTVGQAIVVDGGLTIPRF